MAVAHAVTVGEYSELNYQDAMNYFKGAPETIIELAKKEALQYVLEDIDEIKVSMKELNIKLEE